MIKRVFDILLSSTGLIVLVPLFVLIGVWIKFDSTGPVFYLQTRVGQYGYLFNIIKFRTMYIRPEKGLDLTIGKDIRITVAGTFLRRYKLDELPQLINVLNGSMSLVGPRPEVPRYVTYYPCEIRALVLSVRPGITDWAAIAYKDENALLAEFSDPERIYIDQVLPTKLESYVRYVRKRNFWVDLHIIFRTIAVLVH